MVHLRSVNRMSTMQICITLFWLLTCFNGLQTIKITKFVVPEVIQYGVQDSVILDCDYTYGNKTPGLMVKWFFKSKTRLVYQWIVSQMAPQAIDILRGRVDLNYKASDDPQTMYRAMRIVKLDTDLSGDYICVVSSFIDEDDRRKHMTVFVPETSFRLIQNKTDDETVNVICTAEGAYPAPNLTIATPEKHLQVSHRVQENNGRYSAVASVTLNDADLPSPAEFICTLRIHQAKYSVRKEAIYYPGPISTTPEMPTAADMQQAGAVNHKDINFYTTLVVIFLTAFTRLMIV